MIYLEFKRKLGDFIVFNLNDIRKIKADFDLRRLSEWQKKGYIQIIRRGYYMFGDRKLSEPILYLTANKIYPPSYVSFESALSHYGLIPEGVYTVTSASSKKTASFKTPIVEFSYRKLKAELMFGYRLEELPGQRYKIAEIEKAVLDYLYLNPKIVDEADFYEWRFNSQEFLAKADMEKLRQYAAAFKNKRLVARVEKLLALMKRAE
ncbi:MAG TPA: hypothetical protein VJC11_03885 [Patescibacteria group bacterium]|nr:hypothetical protein [Patescibacteria group bacterium]